MRKPDAGHFENSGPVAATVCVRLPGNPLISVLMRKPDAGHFENFGPAGAAGLRTIPRKSIDFGFDAQTGCRAL